MSNQSAIGNRQSAIDRVLPHSLEAEMGLLGSALLDAKEVLPEVVAVVAEESDHFYTHSHKVIYETLLAMHQASEPPDMVTLTQRLKDKNKLDECGGPIYVTRLFTSVPTAGNWQYYLNIVRDKYLLRRLIDHSATTTARCYDEPDAVAEILDDTERAVFAICDRGVADTSRTVRAIIPEVFVTIEKLYNNKGALTGLPTGFRDYDKLTSGLHNGDMTIFAARPGVGKTSWALNVADHIGVTAGKPVAFFSLEMNSESVVTRMLCARSQVDSHKLRSGYLSQADMPRLSNAAAELAAAKIHIDDASSMTILQLRAKARRLKARHGIELIIVDYLQLVSDPSIRGKDGRQAEVASVSRQLKALAKELKVPIIVLCQLNRDIEKRGDNARPRLADLRESGSIEQDADLVVFLTRKEDGTENGEQRTENQIIESTLIVAKQRSGPTADVPLVYKGGYTRFFDATKVHHGDTE